MLTHEHDLHEEVRGSSASSRTFTAKCTAEMTGMVTDEAGASCQGQNSHFIRQQKRVVLNDKEPREDVGSILKMETQSETLEDDKGQLMCNRSETQLQVEIEVTFSIGTSKDFKITTTFKCSLHAYMVWKYILNSPKQCQKCENQFSSEKIKLKPNSAITVSSHVKNKEHAKHIAEKVFEYAIHNLGSVLCVELVKCNTKDTIKDAEKYNDSFGQEVAYTEAVEGRIYIVFPTTLRENMKQFIIGCTDEKGKGLITKNVTVKNVLLKIPSIKHAYLHSDSVLLSHEDQENVVVCTVKGTESVVKRVINELESKKACLISDDVTFSTRINNALEDLNVEDIVNKCLGKLFPNCVLEQTGRCLRLFSVIENELLKAVSYVGDLIIEWEHRLHGDESKKTAAVKHLQTKYEGKLLVGFDEKNSRLYIIGLKDAVENAQTELMDIQEGRITIDIEVSETVSQPEVIDNYLVRNSLHFRYLENTEHIRKASQQTRELKTTVCKGQLHQIEADVLVNTTTPNLDLTKGYVSTSLSRTAGPGLQQECLRVYPRGIGSDEVAVTNGYNTGCKNIFHVALPPFSYYAPTSCIEGFHNVMMHCLETAASLKHTSIAFPAIGTGSLGYPVEVVASEMFSTIEKFKAKNSSTTLETVLFVIYDKNDDVFQCFQKMEKEMSKSTVLPSTKHKMKSAVRINITGTKKDIDNVRTHLDKTLEGMGAPAIAVKSITDVSITVFRAVKELYDIELNSLRDGGVDIEYIQSRNELSVRGQTDLVTSSMKTLNQYLTEVKEMQTCEISISHVSTTSVEQILCDMRYGRKGVCYIHDQVSRHITVFAKSNRILCFIRRDLEIKLNDADHSTNDQAATSRHEEEMDTPETIGNFGASSILSKPIEQRSFSWSENSKHLRVYRHRNIVVKVYEANILDIPVDVIVNAANKDLQHCGGIAFAIANAAGLAVEQESECLIRENKGSLDVASVLYTSAGCLDYKCILHAVGPRWSDYKPITKISLKECERDLKRTVIRCFRMAEEKDLETVALPTISSGIFKVPQDVCAIQYAKAVMEFEGRKKLKEIHFVDLDRSMIDIIHKTFDAMITEKQKPPFDVNIYLRHGTASDMIPPEHITHYKNERGTTINWPKHPGGNGQEKITGIIASFRSDGTKLALVFESKPVADVYEGDILHLFGIEGIVCSEDPLGQAKGMIAKLLLQKGGQEYRNVKSLLFTSRRSEGEVIITTAGNHSFKWIFHTIVSRNITERMALIYGNILEAAKERQIVSLALPLLGTDSGDIDEVRSTEELFKELVEFHRNNKHYLLKVHVVLRDKTVASVVKDEFKRLVNAMNLQKKDDVNINSLQTAVDETTESKDEEKTNVNT